MKFFRGARKAGGWLAVGFAADGVSVASVRRTADKPVVEMSAFFASDKPQAPETLERIAKDLHATNFNCLSFLNGGEYQLVSVDAPNVPADELRTAVKWRLKDILDFKVEDATVDVLNLPDPSGQMRSASVFAIAARNSVIKSRQDLFADAKLRLSVIDIPEMAQRNISAILEPEGRGLALLSFGNDGGLLTVTFKGELYLSRRIDVALAQLLDNNADVRNGHFDRITLELQRSLDHFDRQFHFINVSKLVLAPTGSDQLMDYLVSNLYMPVEQLDLASIMELDKVADLQTPQGQQKFFMVLGAALRQEGGAV